MAADKTVFDILNGAGDDPQARIDALSKGFESYRNGGDDYSKAMMGVYDAINGPDSLVIDNFGVNGTSGVTGLDMPMLEMVCQDDTISPVFEAMDKASGKQSTVQERAGLVLGMICMDSDKYIIPGDSITPTGLMSKIQVNRTSEKSEEELAAEAAQAELESGAVAGERPMPEDPEEQAGPKPDGNARNERGTDGQRRKPDGGSRDEDDEEEAAEAEEAEEKERKRKAERDSLWSDLADDSGGMVPDSYFRQMQIVHNVIQTLARDNVQYKNLSDASQFLTDKRRATVAGRRLARNFERINMDHAKLVALGMDMENSIAHNILGTIGQQVPGYEAPDIKLGETRVSPLSVLAEKVRGAGRAVKEKAIDIRLDREDAKSEAEKRKAMEEAGAPEFLIKESTKPVPAGRFSMAVPFFGAKSVVQNIRNRIAEARKENEGKDKTKEGVLLEYASAVDTDPEPANPEKGFSRLWSAAKAKAAGIFRKAKQKEAVEGYDLEEDGAGYPQPQEEQGDSAVPDIADASPQQDGAAYGTGPAGMSDIDSYDIDDGSAGMDDGYDDSAYAADDGYLDWDAGAFDGMPLEEDDDEEEEAADDAAAGGPGIEGAMAGDKAGMAGNSISPQPASGPAGGIAVPGVSKEDAEILYQMGISDDWIQELVAGLPDDTPAPAFPDWEGGKRHLTDEQLSAAMDPSGHVQGAAPEGGIQAEAGCIGEAHASLEADGGQAAVAPAAEGLPEKAGQEEGQPARKGVDGAVKDLCGKARELAEKQPFGTSAVRSEKADALVRRAESEMEEENLLSSSRDDGYGVV